MALAETGSEALAGLGRRLRLAARARPVALAPLAVTLAWWSGDAWLLFVASLVLPVWLAARELGGLLDVPEPLLDREDPPGPAERDPVSGLGNEAYLLRRTRGFLAARERSGAGTAMFVLSLHGFDTLRARLGLDRTEQLLAQVGARLIGATRRADAVARLEGGVFAVALAPFAGTQLDLLVRVAERLQAAVEAPVSIGSIRVAPTCAIGLCTAARAPAPRAHALLEAADVARREAERAGGGIRAFTRSMQIAVQRRSARAAELADALEAGQFRAWFQPQIVLATGAVAGFEALVRWEHPEDGVLAPGAFLDDLVASGLAEPLGRSVLRQALAALRQWRAAGYDVPAVGVNYTSEELRSPALADRLLAELDRHGLVPSDLCIEILETVICDSDDDMIARNIRRLASLGFRIDLDDFGTGHAAIANMRRFSVRRIKIDRSFVRGIDSDPAQRRLVEAMISMARSLEVETLAEGVETLAEQATLARLGCDHAQGFGLARPMPLEASLAWLGSRGAAIARRPVALIGGRA